MPCLVLFIIIIIIIIIVIIVIIIIIIIIIIISSASSLPGWSGYVDQVHRRGSQCFLSKIWAFTWIN